jgi:N-hydroxyarylamine O-acetyltransferase
MNLDSYLKRIRYEGELTPDLATLTGIHRAHLINIAYENLDIHLGCPLSTDLEQIYDKIVANRRGGWCFEMNGLLAWALREVGFKVTMLSSFVGREKNEPAPEGAGDHLILRIDLDRPYLADTGFGNGILEPLPLAEGMYQQGFLDFKLEEDHGRWWFTNHAYGGPGFDFDLKPHELSDFAGQSTRLQTSPESGFVKTTVCFRYTPDCLLTLRGAVFRTTTAAGERDEIIDSARRYAQVLADEFDLHLPDVDTLWGTIWKKHQEWVKNQ